jgi:DNA-binding response OmpR family regulator
MVSRNGLVVVVETNDLIRDLVLRWLEDAGYEVALRPPPGPGDGTSAAEHPRLVIVDLPHPRPDEDALQRLRLSYACPVLALSGRFRRGLIGSDAAASRLGADQVLPKPFTRDELLDAVTAALACER